MNLDKYIEESKKTKSALVVLIDGDKVVHSPIRKSMLEVPGGLEVVVKSLKAMLYGNTDGAAKACKCTKCGVKKK